ncbi:hypothetical protein C672_3544 [[Clostridium] bifermentans ATCC 638]|uniref:Type II secretion system (T2SS), F family protein n=1 Tax=Paraclostridium bifermentans ATCC 638 = DSM 14991 TaxID=1233171 RepID=T4VER8_PARBF|nr:hypothetical protein [Paraclostridium bifermentans]EQK40018.1 hypothetical protein C672_3544 [[Clostridium] bifermentans ATCC 638] [Paraclostridium bifermentans ATCC 638 = DSM 14991]RIZ57387.1 hypothetical protein CHH45_16575 [Paraclostridium bifermentans]UAG19936.1 hypothetical protein KXZ80_17180 [Paraclostridium bifermentans]
MEIIEERKTIWHKLAEKDLYKMFKELSYTDEMFIKFQKNRFKKCFLFLLTGLILGFIDIKLILIGVILALFQWTSLYKKAKSFYNNSIFKKQLTFSKFTRMLIPYLLQSNATLYNVFNKMVDRLEDGHVKDSLKKLIIEMNDNPNSEEPFKEFALSASGTDQAVLFMTTLYDYQQNTFDSSVVTELGKMASEQLFNGVDEIISFKLRKFDMFPTKITMLCLLITMGYLLAILVYLAKANL